MASKRQEDLPADFRERCELARLIVEAALEKCERLGVKVQFCVGISPYYLMPRKLRYGATIGKAGFGGRFTSYVEGTNG